MAGERAKRRTGSATRTPPPLPHTTCSHSTQRPCDNREVTNGGAKKRRSASHPRREEPPRAQQPLLSRTAAYASRRGGTGRSWRDLGRSCGNATALARSRSKPGTPGTDRSPRVWAAPCFLLRRTRIRVPYSPLLQVPGPPLGPPRTPRGSTRAMAGRHGSPRGPAESTRPRSPLR